MTPAWNPLRQVDAYPLGRQEDLARRIGALLHADGETVLVPGEAIVALEAVARGLGRPAARALNIVTSPYGHLFGQWLHEAGATVLTVESEAGQRVTVDAVRAAIEAAGRLDLVVLVHGEAASGIVNPLSRIAALAKDAGALVVVDAVASVGAHPLDAARDRLDVVVTGPQKALGGPAGLSAVTLSGSGATAIRRSPVQSSVTLPASTGDAPLGTPDPLSYWALEAALDAVESEGVGARIARHARAAAAARAGLRALGIAPWVREDEAASHLVTAAAVPAGLDAAALIERITALDEGAASPGLGNGGSRFVRLNHTDGRAGFAPVLAAVVAYGRALADLGGAVDVGAGAGAVAAVYAQG